MLRDRSALVIALAALVAGCSDAGSGAIDLPEGTRGGSVLHGTVRGIGGNTNSAVIPGDDAGGVTYRSTLGFDLTKLPSGATVTQATLTVTQCRVGGSPYTALGSLMVDQIDLNNGLSDAAFSGLTIAGSIGTLSSSAAIGPRTLDVTTQVKADVAAHRAVSGFRLRFSARDTNGDAVSDFIQIALPRDGVCSTSAPPQLHVAYD
ncbi:MAG TPA: hypothetical protein VHM30_07940 [Gemmatimonadaceae bacterium]|nr:hypothetical protein [Gemmatimonadaceae bacterium]